MLQARRSHRHNFYEFLFNYLQIKGQRNVHLRRNLLNGKMTKWLNVSMVKWQNGEMVKWQNCTIV
jgi:hypothetical protein